MPARGASPASHLRDVPSADAVRMVAVPRPSGWHADCRVLRRSLPTDTTLGRQSGGYERALATSAITLCDQAACDPRRAVPDRPQIIQPLDVQIARAVTRTVPGDAPVRGAGSPLTATRVDGLEPCSIVDDDGTRFLKASSAYPDPDPGFHPDPGSLWYPGAGTLPPLSALRELLPRGGLVRGRASRR